MNRGVRVKMREVAALASAPLVALLVFTPPAEADGEIIRV